MPIYMDRHDVSEMVTAENVAQLHQQDLKIQDKFGCKGLTYWFDENRKTAFCLIEAPSEQHIIDMHNNAHGEVPHQVIEVDADVVESFLGRIEDPENEDNNQMNIITEPAFRAIMYTGFSNASFKEVAINGENINPSDCLNSLENIFHQFKGKIAQRHRNDFIVSFESVSQAVWCAMEVYTKFEDWSNAVHCKKTRLKTGISTGDPVTENKSFFEDAKKLAERLFYIATDKILVSAEVKKIYKHDNLDVFLDDNLFVALHPSEEHFLDNMMNYIEETWQNPDLHVDDFGRFLGYSKSQLYRNMVSLTGLSPNNFIKEYRLNKALTLINKQTSNISEIAYETGFNSPSYFAKCFHKKFGLTPSDYLHLLTE
ncbi:nickel-binding protein [Sunxiuqinia sp. A32]|uniref:nickel-binding protein n=1 Tax=Sunxiuqinia sp. A32 TaxID=3461496 RepID=UPI004045BD93